MRPLRSSTRGSSGAGLYHRPKGAVGDDESIPRYDWISSKVEIRPSAIHGKGMFAVATLAQDEVVTVWGGKFVSGNDAARAKLAGKAVQQIGEGVFEVFDRDQPELSYYHNHSREPNTGMGDKVTIVALRTIAPGEELTIDYAMFEADEDHVMPWECRCGTPLCRTRITGRDWRSRELQARYGHHFSPLLTRRMGREQDQTGIDTRLPSSNTPGAELHIKAV